MPYLDGEPMASSQLLELIKGGELVQRVFPGDEDVGRLEVCSQDGDKRATSTHK
jgi:hypothetical protein